MARGTSIVYLSHATSVDNEAGRASGHADVGLSALGREQAVALRNRILVERPVAVFTSDLLRAKESASLAFDGTGLPIMHDARLREVDYGVLTQNRSADIEATRASYIDARYPNGESYADVVRRVRLWLND